MSPWYLVTISSLLVVFFTIPFVNRKEAHKYCLLVSSVACIITGIAFTVDFNDFIVAMNLQPILFIVSLFMIVQVIEKNGVFEYIVVKIVHVSKHNLRVLFFLLCIAAALLSTFIENVVTAFVFVPIVIKTARLLKFNPVPFIHGLSFSIIIGNLLTPFATTSNILLASILAVDRGWFFERFWLLFVILLSMFLLIVDRHRIRHMKAPDRTAIDVMCQFMCMDVLIQDKRKFALNVGMLAFILVGLISFPVPPFLFAGLAMIGTFIIEKESMPDQLKVSDWRLYIFLISLLMMAACLLLSGTIELMASLFMQLTGENAIVLIIVVTISSAIGSMLLTKKGSIILFANMILALPPAVPKDVLAMALVIGAIIGGNMVPHAAPHVMKTAALAREHDISGISYRSITKQSIIFALVAMTIGIVYVTTIFLLT